LVVIVCILFCFIAVETLQKNRICWQTIGWTSDPLDSPHNTLPYIMLPPIALFSHFMGIVRIYDNNNPFVSDFKEVYLKYMSLS
jgi:hypothetical protein